MLLYYAKITIDTILFSKDNFLCQAWRNFKMMKNCTILSISHQILSRTSVVTAETSLRSKIINNFDVFTFCLTAKKNAFRKSRCSTTVWCLEFWFQIKPLNAYLLLVLFLFRLCILRPIFIFTFTFHVWKRVLN